MVESDPKFTMQLYGITSDINETFTFEMKSSFNKFTRTELLSQKAVIILNIFDILSYQKQSRMDAAEINVGMIKRFMGSIEVPLATVLINDGVIEGNFKINRPLTLLN